MMRFLDPALRRGIDGPISRREWLRLGGLGAAAGWQTLLANRAAAAPIQGEAASAPGFGRAKSVVVLFAGGGQSQIDTWDPKPDAPVEIRGEFASIPTALPGVRFCEHLPRSARIANRLSVVRSMSHEDLDHGSAIYLALTGHYHRKRSGNPPPSGEDFPCQGAILSQLRPTLEFAQTAVHVNGPVIAPREPAPGQYPGFLGARYAPLTLGDASSSEMAVPGLAPQQQLPAVRIDRRRQLLQQVEQSLAGWDDAPEAVRSDLLYQQAFEMLAKPQTRLAFDLRQEPDAVRLRYGLNRTGQGCLLARRLVEAGCPMVTVFLNHNVRGQDSAAEDIDEWGWDTHNDIFDGLKNWLLPRFDQAFAAFIEDMDARGLLDETLVICMGEFGRAPLVALEKRFAGSSPGRKHWGSVYSVLFAGAGVTRGQTVGASDSAGAYPATQSFAPWDVTATMFSALGIDPAGHYSDSAGRPFKISEGRVMRELYA